jgi:hypothetical protein
MHSRSPVPVWAAAFLLAGCVGWQGQTGKDAISPGVSFRDPPPPARARLIGTLWPPAEEPTFVVAGREIAIAREGERVGETATDSRGRFEVRPARTGRYTFTFSASAHHATADVAIVDSYATYRLDLVTRRD